MTRIGVIIPKMEDERLKTGPSPLGTRTRIAPKILRGAKPLLQKYAS